MSGTQRLRGRIAVLVGGGVLLVLAVMLAGPSGAPSEERGPSGTLALRQYLGLLGMDVTMSDRLPSNRGTFVLLADLRSEEQARPLLHWVEEGGRLVIADPSSSILSSLGVRQAGPIGGIYGTSPIAPRCSTPDAVGIRSLVVSVSDRALEGDNPSAFTCFPGGRGSFEVLVRRGRGTVVMLGGDSPLTNQLLRSGDNAGFATSAMGNGPVVFGPPLPREAEEEPRGLWASLPAGGRAVIFELALAVVAFALVRGRRLGRPVIEEPLSPIPATELVRAAGRLYRVAQAAGYCGRLLRESTGAHLGRRLGIPSPAPPDVLVTSLAARGLPPAAARAALEGPEPSTDEQLIALDRELQYIRDQVEGARP